MSNKVDIMVASIIDDDEDLADALADRLEARGVHPESYRFHVDPNEFLESLNEQVGVAAIDHNINGRGDGLDVMRQFKKRNSSNYGIAVTGQEDYRVVIDYIKAGADDYVDKNKGGSEYLDELADAIVKGFVKAAQKKKEEAERQEYFKIINEGARRVDELFNQLP
jgi:FixJ family two-component response regulator